MAIVLQPYVIYVDQSNIDTLNSHNAIMSNVFQLKILNT